MPSVAEVSVRSSAGMSAAPARHCALPGSLVAASSSTLPHRSRSASRMPELWDSSPSHVIARSAWTSNRSLPPATWRRSATAISREIGSPGFARGLNETRASVGFGYGPRSKHSPSSMVVDSSTPKPRSFFFPVRHTVSDSDPPPTMWRRWSTTARGRGSRTCDSRRQRPRQRIDRLSMDQGWAARTRPAIRRRSRSPREPNAPPRVSTSPTVMRRTSTKAKA
jgi:hypothetical protein